ncbi:MAG: (Fe-S)-binding protein [Promethearchaeia archaeon]
MKLITEINEKDNSEQSIEDSELYLDKIYEPNLRKLLSKCYQCVRCSGVCQLSKVQSFVPSVIIQRILEGSEDKVISSGVLWDCLTCNSCLQNCPEDINFADIVRNAKYKMKNDYKQNPEQYIAHRGIYTTVSEILSEPYIQPKKNLDWVPKECKISDKGDILYFVGCIPYFKFEFQEVDPIPISSLKILCQIENRPIVVLKDEVCCGHDLYWGLGNFEAFIKLAKKNYNLFEKSGVSTIITSCAEGYRTFKVEYPKLFEDFDKKFEVKHIIEYVYEKLKQGKVELKAPDESDINIQFTYHDPCRLSRFLPKSNTLLKKLREIFNILEGIGYSFKEMIHNKENALCCGVSSWMNCNTRSKALRYSRLLEAKEAGTTLVTSCPKCIMHLSCLQKDYDDLSSIEIKDFSEFLVNLIHVIDSKNNGEVKS